MVLQCFKLRSKAFTMLHVLRSSKSLAYAVCYVHKRQNNSVMCVYVLCVGATLM